MSKPEDYRQIFAMPWRRKHGPRKIVMDVYDDGYTPFDCMSAVSCFILENQDILERFREYVDDDAAPENFSGEDAERHLRLMLQLMVTVWEAPESTNIYITGNKGWGN